MIALRSDQEQAVSDLRTALGEHQSVLLRAPCRWGKTVVASYLAQRSSARRKKVIFACHRDAILQQISKTFDRFGVKHGFIASGRPSNPFAFAQVASADTLRNRPGALKDCALFVVDECHLWNSKSRKALIDAAREAGAKVIGLSATPVRLDGKPLRDLFDEIVYGPSEEWLIEQGLLASYRVYAPVSVDLTGVRTSGYDYAASDVESRLDKPSIVGDAPAMWKRYAQGKRTVVYAISRAHGKHVLAAYLEAGVKAAYIDGETPRGEQRRIAISMADGGTEVLVSVDLLTTGFDLASLVDRDVSIQCVQILRPTKSLQLAIQMMMRCMTRQDGDSIILDHVNMILNRDGTLNHGFPDDHREWSLDGRPQRVSDGVSAFNIWTCETCFASVRSVKPICPYCETGHAVKPRSINTEAGDLVEIRREKEHQRIIARRSVGKARTVEDLARIAVERSYKPAWILQQMRARGQRPPEYGELFRAMANARQSVAA